jgi:uncharacterized membrane protein YecN with MAPEG domain
VVRQRRTHKVPQGHGGHAALEGAVRAFGNASEYIPAGIAALALLAVVGASPLIVHAAGLLLFLGRLVHALGLSRTTGVSIGRVAGMTLTWLAYVFSAAVLLLYAVG